jgi:hypothetical protein
MNSASAEPRARDAYAHWRSRRRHDALAGHLPGGDGVGVVGVERREGVVGDVEDVAQPPTCEGR